MPRFDSQAPPDLGRSGYRLVRTPAAHALTAHVISDRLIGCPTHFVGNRTIPCERPSCDPCESGVPWRWHGYLAIVIDATQEIVIFETTAKASAAFVDYYERMNTTRGCHMKAQRVNGKHNGRVLIQCKPADLAKIHLPESPNVEKVLCHIWNIPENQVNKSDSMTRPPADNIEVDRDRPELSPGRALSAERSINYAAAIARRGNGSKHDDPAA